MRKTTDHLKEAKEQAAAAVKSGASTVYGGAKRLSSAAYGAAMDARESIKLKIKEIALNKWIIKVSVELADKGRGFAPGGKQEATDFFNSKYDSEKSKDIFDAYIAMDEKAYNNRTQAASSAARAPLVRSSVQLDASRLEELRKQLATSEEQVRKLEQELEKAKKESSVLSAPRASVAASSMLATPRASVQAASSTSAAPRASTQVAPRASVKPANVAEVSTQQHGSVISEDRVIRLISEYKIPNNANSNIKKAEIIGSVTKLARMRKMTDEEQVKTILKSKVGEAFPDLVEAVKIEKTKSKSTTAKAPQPQAKPGGLSMIDEMKVKQAAKKKL